MTWQRIAGGCLLLSDTEYPCDDQYENTETMERVTVYSTQERHFTMPTQVASPSELHDLSGVDQRKKR